MYDIYISIYISTTRKINFSLHMCTLERFQISQPAERATDAGYCSVKTAIYVSVQQ